MMKRIALIGRSDLAEAYRRDHTHHAYQEFFRPDYDITVQADCDSIVDQAKADVFLISAGLYHGDAWTLWMTNCVGPSYLASRLHETQHQAHIIIVGSLGARWVSWPGIDSERLVYNAAKHAVSHFAQELYQSSINDNRITVVDPGRFQSRLNDHTGMAVDRVTDLLDRIITSSPDTNVVNVQLAWHRDRKPQPGDRHDK